MRNFQQIVKDVSNLKWSTVVLEEAFAEVEDNVKLAVRQANSYIFGLKDFPFRIKKGGLTTKENAFPAPNGDILQMWMQDGSRYLQKIAPEDGDLLDMSKTGRPELYWADFGDNGAVVHLWPAPDREYSFFYRYANNMKARDAAGNEKFNLEDLDDMVNIPDNPAIEDLFMHCLYTKSMVYLIADETDENYQPYEREFREAWYNLLDVAGVKKAPKLVI